MQDFLKYPGQTAEQMREMYKGEATDRVKTQLVMEAIRKAEQVEATQEEADAEMQRYADQSKKSLDEFKATLSDDDKEYFQAAAATRKTIDLIKNAAKE